LCNTGAAKRTVDAADADIRRSLRLSNMVSKVLLTGLGLASLTKEAIQKSVNDLVDQSTISEQEGRKLLKELQQRSAHAQRDLEKKIDTAVDKALKSLGLTRTSTLNKRAKAAKKRTKTATKRAKVGAKRSGGRARRTKKTGG